FFFQAEDGIRDRTVTGVQTCALPISDVSLVLTELAQAAGLDFSIEAGAIQRVPAEFRKVTLLLENARVREALEDIRGVTGLDYEIGRASCRERVEIAVVEVTAEKILM